MPRYEVRFSDGEVLIAMDAPSARDNPSAIIGDLNDGATTAYAQEMADMGFTVAQIASRLGSYSGLYEVDDEPPASTHSGPA
jgi:hypothetical protein